MSGCNELLYVSSANLGISTSDGRLAIFSLCMAVSRVACRPILGARALFGESIHMCAVLSCGTGVCPVATHPIAR
eukprot:scaffold118942_cov36-Prasinocladus_malaysianus.AAC.1